MTKLKRFPGLDTLITTGQRGAKMKFINNDGSIELEGKFPKKMSLKQAIRGSVEKHEFILAELLAGRRVKTDGGDETCALCQYADRIYYASETIQDECHICIICHKTGKSNCDDTPLDNMESNRRKDGSFRIPNVRREIKFLKALEVDYE